MNGEPSVAGWPSAARPGWQPLQWQGKRWWAVATVGRLSILRGEHVKQLAGCGGMTTGSLAGLSRPL